RAIWVMDDISPLRRMIAMPFRESAYLFPPATAFRVRRNQNKDTPLPPDEPVGKNPPAGAVIDYWRRRDAVTPVSVEIRDGSGGIVRRFASDDGTPKLRADRYFAERWVRPVAPLPAKAGVHRFVWDLRTERPRCSRYEYSIAAVDGEDTPKVPEGMLVPPGVYQVTLAGGDRKYIAPLVVDPDPRVPGGLPSLQAAFRRPRGVATK